MEVHCIGETNSGKYIIELWDTDSHLLNSHLKNFQDLWNIHLHLLHRSPMESTADGLLFHVCAHERLKPGYSGFVELDVYVKGNYHGFGIFLKEVYDVYPSVKTRPSVLRSALLPNFTPLSGEAVYGNPPLFVPNQRSNAPPPPPPPHGTPGPNATFVPDWQHYDDMTYYQTSTSWTTTNQSNEPN